VIVLRKPWGVVAVAVAGLLYAVGLGLALSGCGTTGSATAVPATGAAATPRPTTSSVRATGAARSTTRPATPLRAGVSSDNGWTLVAAPKVTRSLGIMTLHARIRNDSDHRTALITLTYDPDGTPVVFSGAANEVARGKTVTVDLVSTDKVDKLPSGTPEMRVAAGF
jgi:hypothetical protein